MRLTYPNRIGMFAKLTHTIGRLGGDLGAVDIVNPDAKRMTRDVTVRARDHEHMEAIVQAMCKLKDVTVAKVSDQVFLLHLGGKISIQYKVPPTTRDTLSMAYTPGVARVCEAIAEQHAKGWQLTIKGNSVAMVSDGSAVLGLGNIGPEAAMPVMEGKAMLFKEFAGIDAYPIGEACAVVESVKTASDIYSPVSGEIIEVSPTVVDNPALVNSEPHTGGWFYKIKLSNAAELEALLSAEDYQQQIGG